MAQRASIVSVTLAADAALVDATEGNRARARAVVLACFAGDARGESVRVADLEAAWGSPAQPAPPGRVAGGGRKRVKGPGAAPAAEPVTPIPQGPAWTVRRCAALMIRAGALRWADDDASFLALDCDAAQAVADRVARGQAALAAWAEAGDRRCAAPTCARWALPDDAADGAEAADCCRACGGGIRVCSTD